MYIQTSRNTWEIKEECFKNC